MPLIYLASQSPRRSQLLAQIGVPHHILVADAALDIAEDAEALEAELPGEAPRDYVQRVTLLKLQAAQQRAQRRALAPESLIVCADTTVALQGQILAKPVDAADARRMLSALSGTQHQVYTAVAVAAGYGPHARTVQALSESVVQFAELSAHETDRYIDSLEWQGKAGGYGIQGLAAAFIAHISGSYSGIMGLPLFETTQLLARVQTTG